MLSGRVALVALLLALTACVQEEPMFAILLEQESAEPIQSPTWDQVDTALRAIDLETNSFFILSGENGYVQTAGTASQLTVEYRVYEADTFSHYRLGREPLSETVAAVRYSAGEIRVRESEVLTIEDCVAIFESYFRHGTVPDDFHLRLLDETYQ